MFEENWPIDTPPTLGKVRSMPLKLLQLLRSDLRGKIRIGKFLLKGINGPRTLNVKQGLQIALPSVVEPVAYHLATNGEYEPDTIKAITTNLSPEGVFVDVGANVGSICLPVSKRRPDTKILAIEADPLIFQYIRHNIVINKVENCIAENCCAGESNGNTSFYPAPCEAFGSGSRSGDPSDLHQAPMYMLDSLVKTHGFSTIDVLKVDVEGWEYLVFKGAEKILTRDPAPVVIFEFNDWAERATGFISVGEAQRFLRSLGYSIWSLNCYLSGLHENKNVLETGSGMLVARRDKCSS